MSLPIQTLPAANVTEIPAGAALAASGIPDVPVFMGPASAGPFTPTLIAASDIATLTATYVNGPTVKEAAIAASQVAQQFVFLRTPAASVAGTVPGSASTVRNASSNFGLVLTGTPTDGADVVITFTLGGTTGTGPITYNVSLDGGVTPGSPVSLGTALIITVLGVTITLITGKIVTTGDTVSWLQTVASATVLPLTFAGTGSSAITVTGTPLDGYEVGFKVITGGTIGTTGITFQYALDYLAPVPTWSPTTSLGTATSFLLLDGPVSTASTGLTLNFAAGTLVAGDLETFNTSLPTYDSAGATSALLALVASGVQWTWIRGVGPQPETIHATLDGIIIGWDSSSKPSWGVGDARDRATTETLAAWSARVDTEFGPYTSTRWTVAKGRARMSCPINGRNNRRSAMAPLMARAMGALGTDISTDWGEFDLGPLPPSVSLVNANLVTVEYDGNKDPTGITLGFVALRSWPGEVGVYPAGATLLAPTGDIQRVPLRRIMNVAKITERAVLKQTVLKDIRFWVKGTTPAAYNVGDIYEPDALNIDTAMNAAQQAAITSNGWASSVTWFTTRKPTSLGGGAWKITGALKMVALGYIVVANGTAQYVSPSS